MAISKEQAEITILNYPECVRKRPDMYLNSQNHCIEEIIANSVDEYLAGRCNLISVEINKDLGVTVTDNGSGIPIKKHKSPAYSHLTQAEVAYTVLHAGGKFGQATGYKTATGGLHGVGASCVNAVSKNLVLTTYQDNKIYEAQFSKGLITKNMKKINEYEEEFSGTQVYFELDPEIWGEIKFDYKKLTRKLKQLGYLNPGLTLAYANELTNENEVFHFPEGLKSYVDKMALAKTPISDTCYVTSEIETMKVQFAFCYTDTYHCEFYSFCNNINTESGGEHVQGFNQGLAKAITDYALEKKVIKPEDKFEQNDFLEGLVGVVSVIHPDPKFDGQGKAKIKMPTIKTPIKNLVAEQIYHFLDSNPKMAQVILDKVLLSQKARLSAQKARETARKSKSLSGGKAKGLTQCTSDNPAECELYIVEGDSAGGTVKNGRERKTQAVLPLFGKPANGEKAGLEKMLNNDKFMEMVRALECGIGDEFDITKCRYHMIIILSDADIDGFHIKTLYMTNYYRYLKPIIEAGYLYMGCPPLYKIISNDKKHSVYAYTEDERDKAVEGFNGKCTVKRYKGLGEMDAEELWETTLNPENRKLIQIVADEDAEDTISLCMGDAVKPRRQFIEENALYAENL